MREFFRLRGHNREAVTTPRVGELVIVADDDDLVRELVLTALGRAGVECRGVVDGEEAIVAVHKLKPRVVILDWLMPGCNGLEACRRLKADSATSAIGVVMLTSRGEEEQVRAAYAAGADDYMTKPFDVAEVVRLVLRTLGRR